MTVLNAITDSYFIFLECLLILRWGSHVVTVILKLEPTSNAHYYFRILFSTILSRYLFFWAWLSNYLFYDLIFDFNSVRGSMFPLKMWNHFCIQNKIFFSKFDFYWNACVYDFYDLLCLLCFDEKDNINIFT